MNRAGRSPMPLACLAAVPLLAQGQAPGPAPAAEPADAGSVLVIGQRESLRAGLQLKRQGAGISDAVVADEINRLPDINLTEALQRVTGVQAARDRGEGAGLTVRGLGQVQATLNGREIFTAGSGRVLDFADLPSEMVAALTVHKSASAEQIEGGIGGLVNLRTRAPFDFAQGATVLSLRALHGDLAGRTEAQGSVLAGRRWRGTDGGEWGWLANVSLQERAFREDQKGTGAPQARSDLLPGQTVFAPGATSESTSAGLRRRTAATLVLQWRSAAGLALRAEAHAAEFRTEQDSQMINVSAGASALPGSVALFEGSRDVRRVTWLDAPVSVLSFARDTVDRSRQFALHAQWRGEAWRVEADISHTRSHNSLYFSGPFFAGRAARFSHDLTGPVPATAVAGTDLLDPATLRYTGLAYRTRVFDGRLDAARLDAHWRPAEGLWRGVDAGWRSARRQAGNAPGLVFGDLSLAGPAMAATPGRVQPNPYADFLPGSTSIGAYLTGRLDNARDAQALREAFGITTPLPTAASPLSLWTIVERSDAGYLMGRFEQAPIDGQLGLRAVRTRSQVTGWRSVPASTGIEPLAIEHRDTDWLPSAHLRWTLRPDLLARLALSRTLTRPNFDQLSPSLTLLRNPITPSLNQGAAGNPELQPVRASNLDLALEHYLGPASAVHATAFVKQVRGFPAIFSAPETHDGEVYLVSRPQNSGAARIRGLELGLQQVFDTLPGAWRGLGLQANLTWLDSRTDDRLLGARVPLQNLSRRSANLVGLYELGPWSARLAWNWRDRFLSGATSVVGLGVLPSYTQAYGWLDASAAWQIDARWRLVAEGSNLLRTRRDAPYGLPTRPQASTLNDRQWGARVVVQL